LAHSRSVWFLAQVKDRFEFPLELDLYPYTVEAADEADGRVRALVARGRWAVRVCDRIRRLSALAARKGSPCCFGPDATDPHS
jgi:hypothetical protein